MNNNLMTQYVVKKGDSLYSIAQLFNTTVAEISDANMLTNTTIYPGQILLIPTPAVPENNPNNNPNNPHTQVALSDYIVQPDDTISSIAQKLGVNPAVLGAYNDFGKLVLKENQVLKVPRRTTTYTIKEGESLTRILSKTNKTAHQLLELNANEWLKSGKTIVIS